MAELVHSSPEESSQFLQRIGLNLDPKLIIESFPVNMSERRVVHTGDRVLKIRPSGEQAEREISQLAKLLTSYKFSGQKFRGLELTRLAKSNYTVIDMPYLGFNMVRLATDLYLLDNGEIEPEKAIFSGFDKRQAERIVDKLRKDHVHFANQSGLIHGDLFQAKSPNNLLLNQGCLLLVDAEAMTELNDDSLARFHEQLDKTEEWIWENLLKTD